MAFVKFERGDSNIYNLEGYAFDTSTLRVSSYKSGSLKTLTRSQSYRLNGVYITESNLFKIASVALIKNSKSTSVSCPEPVQVSGDRIEKQFIMFSIKDEVSQFFRAGTSIKEAFNVFAKRGVILDPANVSILDVKTGSIKQLVKSVVTSYRYE